MACSTSLAQDGSLPVYVPLYAGGGAICGPISLGAQAGSDANGAVVWFKPAAASRVFYPAGWPDGVTLDVRGSHFVPPAAGAPGILNVLGLSGTTSVSLLGGNLRADVKLPASISADNITLTPPAAIQGFNFTINPANGVFRGRFVDPASKQPRQFRGVLLQNQSEAAGFFLGTTESGAIEIAPGSTN